MKTQRTVQDAQQCRHAVHFGSVHCLLEQRLFEPLHLQYALSDFQLLEELYLLGGSKEGQTLERGKEGGGNEE